MTRQPRAVLFDLDDTIVDDSSNVEASWRAVCREAVGRLEGLDPAALYEAVQRQRDWYWSDPQRHREGRLDLRAASARIVEAALRSLGVEAADLALTLGNQYRDLREEGIRPFPGAIETLAAMLAAGVRLALITNGGPASQRPKIERFDLARYFDCILIEDEFGCGKPDRRVYEAALRALGARPQQAWSVGDNLEWDVAAPQRLGLYGVWVDAARSGLPAGAVVRPDRIISGISELAPAP